MSLIYNGTEVKKLIYNGTEVKVGYYGSTQVYSGETVYVWNKYNVVKSGGYYALSNNKGLSPRFASTYDGYSSYNGYITYDKTSTIEGYIGICIVSKTGVYTYYSTYYVSVTYSKGSTSYGTVTSTNRSAYPDSGTPDNTYWYEYVGVQS